MGLPDEIEQEIRQTAERSPFFLNVKGGFEELGTVNTQTFDGLKDQQALIQKLLMWHMEVTEAHREAILRLAREIEDLNARIADLDKE